MMPTQSAEHRSTRVPTPAFLPSPGTVEMMSTSSISAAPAAPGSRLVLIDGHNLAYRAFYAMQRNPLQTPDGRNVSVPWGVHRTVKRLLRELRPDYCAFVLEGGSSGREELFADYKATRRQMPEAMRATLPIMERLVEAMGILVLRQDGYEADDVIGTLAVKAAAAGIEAVIVTADKDFVQLVREGIALYHPGANPRSGKQPVWTDVSNAHERFGVPPEHICDYLALVGDASDNVPGAKGIGPAMAVELIHKFGRVEDLLEHIVNVERRRARLVLNESKEDVLLSKRLVTIQTDVPLPKLGQRLRLRDPDPQALQDVLSEIAYQETAVSRSR